MITFHLVTDGESIGDPQAWISVDELTTIKGVCRDTFVFDAKPLNVYTFVGWIVKCYRWALDNKYGVDLFADLP